MRPEFLQPGEEPILLLRRDPRSAYDAWLGIAVAWLVVAGGAFAVAAFVFAAAAPYAVSVVLVSALAAGVGALTVGFRVRTSRNVITADRVYHAHGKLRFFLSQTTYDRVTDLHVHQSLFGRWLGFGNVLVQTSGLGVHLVGVPDPFTVKATIETAREAMIQRLVAKHGRARKAATTSTAAPRTSKTPVATGPTWTAGPTLASVLVRYLAPSIVLVGFLAFSGPVAFLTNSPYAVVLPVALILVGGLVGWNAVMQFRRTHYEIHPWGVAVTSGWLSRRRVEARYEKVTDVTVTQPVLGRLFGFGTLQINTAGGTEAPIQFHGVRNPDVVKGLVDEARAPRGPA